MSLYRFLPLCALSAIAIAGIPAAIAQSAPLAQPTSPSRGVLKMVMIDQAQLSPDQRQAFQQYLRTANLPRTKIGERCQYYGRPQIWCLLLDPPQAQQVYQQLKEQPTFGTATEIKEVRPLRAVPRPSPSI